MKKFDLHSGVLLNEKQYHSLKRIAASMQHTENETDPGGNRSGSPNSHWQRSKEHTIPRKGGSPHTNKYLNIVILVGMALRKALSTFKLL